MNAGPAGNPLARLLGLQLQAHSAGHSVMTVQVAPDHLNPNQVVHGAVMFALADTGMGAALFPTLAAGQLCATIELKINYFKPVREGLLRCETEIVNRGKTVANLQSRILHDDTLVALANGNYAIFSPSARATA